MPSLKVKALEDMWAFADLIQFKGGSANFCPMQIEMGNHTQRPQRDNLPEHRRRINLVPRGHLKSTINTTLYILWRIYRNPNIRILVGCNEKKLSQSFIRELRSYLENEELQETVWNKRPHILGPLVPKLHSVGRRKAKEEDDTIAEDRKILWNNEAIQVIRSHIYKEPTVAAYSVNMSIAGNHYDLLVLDDIVDFINSNSVVKADSIYNWAQDLESVIKRNSEWQEIAGSFGEFVGDEIVINGTRYYSYDYYSHYVGNSPDEQSKLLQEMGYTCFSCNIYVNGKDGTDGYVYPTEFSDAVVKRLKRQLKYRKFAAQYLMKIVSDENQTFDIRNIQYINEANIEILGNSTVRLTHDKQAKLIRLYMVLDLAAATHKKADHSDIAVGGMDADGNLFLVDLRERRLKPSKLIDLIYTVADKWRLHGIWIEKNGQQELFINVLKDEFTRRRPLVVRTIHHSTNKNLRIEAHLEPYVSNNKFYMVSTIASYTELVSHMEMFSLEGNLDYDDDLDAVATLAEVAKPTVQRSGSSNSLVYSSPHTTVNKKYGGCR